MSDTTKVIISAVVCLSIGLFIAWVIFPRTKQVTITDCPAPKSIYDNDPSTIACKERGGIPIYSSWDGRLKDCKF